MDIDIKDRKILYELDKEGRQSNTQIARHVGSSKQVVGFRIKKLMQDNLITKFFTIIDISKLGFTIHKIFLRLQNLDEKKEKELIKYLVEHNSVVWVAGCDGRFDLAFGTWAKNIEHLDITLKEINKKFGTIIAERQIATIIRGEYFPRDYLVNQLRSKSKQHYSFGSVPVPEKIDEIDWKILNELGKDARKSAVEIADNIKVTAETVGDHIKKLEKSNIIKGYNIMPNEENYPYLHYKVLVGLKNIAEEKEQEFINYCSKNSSIVYIVKALGSWEFELDIEVENAKKLRDIMMEIKTNFKDILKDYSILTIYRAYKYNFCPSIQR